MKPILIAFLAVFLWGCGSGNQEQNTLSKETLGQKLASIELNKEVTVTDKYVVQLDSMINLLAARYKEPKDSIAEYTERCNTILNNEQINENNLDLMIGVSNMGEIPNTKYKEAIVLLSVMIKGSNKSN